MKSFKQFLTESFSKEQINKLKAEYGTMQKIDPTSPSYKKLVALLDNLPQDHLKQLASADIKFISPLAKNRIKKPVSEAGGLDERCWDGYKPTPGKKPYEKGSCMKEDDEDLQEESEHEGKKVTLNKPFRTPDGPKKFAVYVKNDKGNVVKVTFGDPNMEIKRDSDDRRANFRARHNCDDPGPKWKARYWSCKMWSNKPVSKIAEETKYDFKMVDGPRTRKVSGGISGAPGKSPEDAIKQRMISFGYRNINITQKDGLYVVKAQWGSNPKDVETSYYELNEAVAGTDASSAARLFAKFLRSTGAPDKVAKFTPKSKSVYKGQSSKFDYYVDLDKRTVTARQRNTFDDSSYVWNDKTNNVKVTEAKLVSESAPPDAKIEKWIKDNKQTFKDKYGDEKGTQILYAKAWKMYNKT